MKNLIFSLSGIVLFMLIGCSSAEPEPTETPVPPTNTPPPPTDTPTPVGFVDHDCNSEEEKDFDDWASWTKVNPTILQSEGHNGWVDIYVDDLAKSTYLEASAPYLECARIVKARHPGETLKVNRLLVMVKMAAGYDPENNDWWYGLYNETGNIEFKAGKVEDCIECHKKAIEMDYLFSKEVLTASNE